MPLARPVLMSWAGCKVHLLLCLSVFTDEKLLWHSMEPWQAL